MREPSKWERPRAKLLSAREIEFDSAREPAVLSGELEMLPGGGYRYVLLNEGVCIEVRYLRREFGHLTAEVDVQCEWIGAAKHGRSLSCADLNLSSQPARAALAKHCAQRARTPSDDFDWMLAIEGACQEVLQAERRGDAIITLDDAPLLQDRDHLVLGFSVPADAASMLIAHGDSMKSLITLYVLGTLATRGFRVLYLDWEWTGDRHRQRKHRLFGGARLDTLKYLRCRAPLTIEADRIRRYCQEQDIDFIAVDSVGLACDGKLVDDDVAIRFHRALGSLPPALCAAHVPKSSLTPETKGHAVGPFGSVFFSNLCRMTWLVKKQPSAVEDVVTVGLFPQKQNDGQRRPPVGFEFNFGGEYIDVRQVEVASVEGLATELPLSVRIKHALRSGPVTYAALAEELGAPVNSVVQAVSRNPRAFVKVPGTDGIQRVALVDRRMG